MGYMNEYEGAANHGHCNWLTGQHTCLKQESSVHPVPLDITEVVVSFLVELKFEGETVVL